MLLCNKMQLEKKRYKLVQTHTHTEQARKTLHRARILITIMGPLVIIYNFLNKLGYYLSLFQKNVKKIGPRRFLDAC